MGKDLHNYNPFKGHWTVFKGC